MAILTRQKIQDYYAEFKSIPITFHKELIQITGLQAKQVILKCASDFFPCVIYSTSFEEAKIVASNKSGLMEKLKETNNSASIKFCFKAPATGEQVAFLVSARVTGLAPYDAGPDMSMFTLQFSQRPPDDLIEIVGRIIEANKSFNRRKNERIAITPETLRKMHFTAKEIGVTIDGVPRRCLLRDISFTGARLVMLGISKFLINKSITIKFDFDEPLESYSINGKSIDVEKVAERNDMVVLNMEYSDPVPMAYKVRLSDYLNTARTDTRASRHASAGNSVSAPADPSDPAVPGA
ncbi:MAG: PilZ domain-containing protein [Spirochaetaceae bacterium]|jgi:c-di-GMP-binding flagellar brake protein YcgR|nr:PilZ domain-containing protein [Spirochaetaceae bacterium]